MSCVSYDTPPMDFKSAVSINAFLRQFEENLNAGGLIRVTPPAGTTIGDTYGNQPYVEYNNLTFEAYYTSFVIKNTSSWYQTQYICSMEYKLPVGNGNIIFEDDIANTGYKKIKKASYDSTEVFIRFNFVFNSVCSGSSASINQRFILCNTVIYNEQYKIIVAQPGTGYLYYDSFNPNTYNTNVTMSGKSYVSLTQNHLTICIGSHTLGGLYYYNNNNFKKYMINFSIYRKNDNIYVYHIYGGAANHSTWYDYYYDDRSDIVLSSYNKLNNKITAWYNRDGRFLYWPIGTSVVAQTTNYVCVGRTYAISDTQNILHIPELVTTRLMDAGSSEFKSSYRINNNRVIGNYVNLGLTERAQCPVDRYTKNYSWAFLYEITTEYTTEYL